MFYFEDSDAFLFQSAFICIFAFVSFEYMNKYNKVADVVEPIKNNFAR